MTGLVNETLDVSTDSAREVFALSPQAGQSLGTRCPLPASNTRIVREDHRAASTVLLPNQQVGRSAPNISLQGKHNGLVVEVTFSVSRNGG